MEAKREQAEKVLRTQADETDRQLFGPVSAELSALLAECEAGGPRDSVSIRGKVLVWSLLEGKRARYAEPGESRAVGPDEEMTVFLARWPRQDRGWVFTSSNDSTQTLLRLKAARIDWEACAIYWPSKEPAGWVYLEGEEPPTSGPDVVTGNGRPPDVRAWISRQLIKTREGVK